MSRNRVEKRMTLIEWNDEIARLVRLAHNARKRAAKYIKLANAMKDKTR